MDRSSGIYRGPALALLTHRGMKAWMDVSSNCLTTASPTIPRTSNREDVLASNQRGEDVLVLAAMALHRYQEANR